MSLVQWIGVGVFGGIIAAIVFVQAGKVGGANGGEQSAMILKGAGTGLSDIISAVETGSGGPNR